MTRLGSFPLEGRVRLVKHSVDQAKERTGKFADGLGPERLGNKMIAEVVDCIQRGLVFDRYPRGFGYYSERQPPPLPPWQRFVQSRDGTRGYIVALDVPPDVTVVTTLHRMPKIPKPVRY